MMHWFRKRSRNKSERSPYWLQLKEQWGYLKERYWDLPMLNKHHDPLYMRRIERRFLPQSYRTGMAYFVTILVISLLAITGMDAHTLAQQKRDELAREVTQTLSLLDRQITEGDQSSARLLDWGLASAFETDEKHALIQDIASEGLNHHLALQGSHKDLVELNLHVSEGYRQLRTLMETWSNTSLSALERLDRVEDLAHKVTAEWVLALESPLLGKSPDLSEDNRIALEAKMYRLRVLKGHFDGLVSALPQLKLLLGAEEPQRILVLIQDGAEQRATGGALSTALELVVVNGRVQSDRVLSLHEIDRLLRADISPPYGLNEVNSRWGLETSNVFLSGVTSAEKLSDFWQQGARSSLDAAFFVDIGSFERLFGSHLKSVLAQYGFSSQSEDMSLLWSRLRKNSDRERLLSMTRALCDALLRASYDPQWVLSHLELMKELADEKMLLSYSPHEALQDWFVDSGMAGSLPSLSPGQDVLMVGHMNLGNNTTDRWVDESRKLHTAIADDGTIKHWLQLSKRHRGDQPREFELAQTLGEKLSPSEVSQLVRQDNVSFTRVLVPKGSVLISSQGVDRLDISISETEDFTVWSFEYRVSAGQTQQVELVYHLPWTFDMASVDNYTLQVLKQPGSKVVAFDHQFKTPLGAQVFQHLPEELPAYLSRDLQLAIVAGQSL